MPSKRRAGDTISPSTEKGDVGKPKKRRVSLACDGCRAAREKCDGGRPQCRACVTQHRSCSYTPATKKRGVQTGYLRTVELSLAWLFDQIPECEESLHQFLGRGEINKETKALLGKGSNGHHLQQLWNQNRVRRAIDGLLGDTQPINSESSENESEAGCERQTKLLRNRSTLPRVSDSSTSQAIPWSLHESESHGSEEYLLKLPSNWERLLDVFVSYTHCWLPIVDPAALRALAEAYPSEGLRVKHNVTDNTYSTHAELWAALSIASFQEKESIGDELFRNLQPSQVFQIARSLIPPDDGTFDLHIISALVLQSLIFVGRGKTFAASLLIGKTKRLLRELQSSNRVPSQDYGDFDAIQFDLVSLACSILDTLMSVFSGHHTLTEPYHSEEGNYDLLLSFSDFDKPWHSTSLHTSTTASSVPTSDFVGRDVARPIQTLVQLHKFSLVLHDGLAPKPRGDSTAEAPDPEELLRKLDPQFNFCNSFISSRSTPKLPSAYLIKLFFFTATIELASEIRPSLLSGCLEIIESCFASFGVNYSSPIVLLLVQKHTKSDDMSESERRKWHSAMERLQNIWQDSAVSSYTPNAIPSISVDEFNQPTFTPLTALPAAYSENENRRPSMSQSVVFGTSDLTTGKSPAGLHIGYENAIPSAAFNTDTLSVATHPNGGREDFRPTFPDNYRMTPTFDYDAIFEDIGSIGYTDNLEIDSRFMTNLGFAPGCDLAEIFQGDFGV